jgi:hypothetical protein
LSHPTALKNLEHRFTQTSREGGDPGLSRSHDCEGADVAGHPVGLHRPKPWVPAFAGMTGIERSAMTGSEEQRRDFDASPSDKSPPGRRPAIERLCGPPGTR